MILPKAQRGNSLPSSYFTPPFPYPAKEPRSLSIRIFLIRSSRLGMSGWSSKRRENQSRLPLRKICSRWTSPTASSIPSPRPQAYSSAAYSFLLAAELCEKPKRNLQKYFQEIILYEDKKLTMPIKIPRTGIQRKMPGAVSPHCKHRQ